MYHFLSHFILDAVSFLPERFLFLLIHTSNAVKKKIEVLSMDYMTYRICKKKVKSSYEQSGPSGWHLSPVSAGGMKRLGVFLLPPGWDASPSQGYPQL